MNKELSEFQKRLQFQPAKPCSRAAQCSATPEIYVFERAEGWYPLELKDDAEAFKNAECNPGTLKVTTKIGRPVWPNAELRKI